ncbi:MAG: hypothetical protein ABSF77_10720 [Spirochaetia bacterium]
MGTAVFIQVRLGSTRLRSKAVLPLPGGMVIQHVMRALQGVTAQARALLTDSQSQDVLLPLARAEGFDVFIGPEEDVLARYCMACRSFGVDRVIRATGDNPLTSGRLARDILTIHGQKQADLSHYLGIPWGTGIEVIQAAALFTAERDATRGDEREHITTYLYRHKDRFRIEEPAAPPDAFFAEGKATVDTQDDYDRMKRIFSDLYRGSPIEIEQVVRWLKTEQGKGAENG